MSAYEIEPLFDRVLLKRVEQEKKYAGIIHLADNAKVKNCLAEVIFVGPGRLDSLGNRVPMQVRPGDIVLIGRYAGLEVEVMDEEGRPEKFVTMVEDEILGRMRRKIAEKPASVDSRRRSELQADRAEEKLG